MERSRLYNHGSKIGKIWHTKSINIIYMWKILYISQKKDWKIFATKKWDMTVHEEYFIPAKIIKELIMVKDDRLCIPLSVY